MPRFPIKKLASGEPAFGTSAGRSYDGGTEKFWALVLASAFLGDDDPASGTGDTGDFSVGNGGLSSGTGSGSGAVGGGSAISWPGDGPAPGDKICYDVRASEKNGAWIAYFGLTDNSNTYYVRVNFATDTLDWGAVEAGTTNQMASTSLSSALDAYGGVGAPQTGTFQPSPSSYSYVDQFSDGSNAVNDVAIHPDGDIMYVAKFDETRVIQYELSTPWDVTTASQTATLSVGNQVVAMDFKPDGSVLSLARGSGNDAGDDWFEYYTLSTPWDITTASLQNSTSAPTEVEGISLSGDGTTMALVSGGGNVIAREYSLSTPWDISTASSTGTSLSAGVSSFSNGVRFAPNGNHLFITGTSSNPGIYQFSLSTPYDISTGTYDGKSSTNGDYPAGVAVRPDLTALYVNERDSVQQYTQSQSFYSVSGTVTDEDGNPVEGATVTDGRGNSATTDANGDYSGNFDQSATEMEAGVDGENIDVVSVSLSGGDVVDFTLPTTESLTYNLEMRWYENNMIDAELYDTDGVTSLGATDPKQSYTHSGGGYGYEFTDAGLYAPSTTVCETGIGDGSMALQHTEGWELESPTRPLQHTEGWEV